MLARKNISMLGALLTCLAILASYPAISQAEEAKSFKKYPAIADYSLVAKYAKVPKPKGAMIIDSRPYKPKYVAGYIPTAVSIPASQFDKMTDQLPSDKGTLLIFYCGGLKCPLSHKSAFKAQALGYTNIKVYAKGFPDWKKHAPYYSVGLETLNKMLADGDDYMLVDARPHKKFLKGAIPSSISIPDRLFAQKRGLLPTEKKNTMLIYYCGGYKCLLSHKSAIKARALGYRKVMVAEAGYPGWKEMYGAGSGMVVQAGEVEGSIDVEQFKKALSENPEAMQVIDVRDPAEFSDGHLPGAVNMTVDQIEKNPEAIASDKPVVFVCSTGARSGEAYYMIREMRPELEEVFYLEAECSYNPDGSYDIKPNK